MATAITPKNLTDSSYAGENMTDATFDDITSGTGVDFNFVDADMVMLYNDHASASRVFTITIPIPADSVLADTNSDPADKTYTVPAKKYWPVPLADAMNDSNGKVTIDCDDTDCKIRAYKVV